MHKTKKYTKIHKGNYKKGVSAVDINLLHFTENLFKRLGLDCHRCSYPLRPNPDYDRGLRNMLFGSTNAFIELAARMQTSMAKNPSRIWILEDLYACNYIFIPQIGRAHV